LIVTQPQLVPQMSVSLDLQYDLHSDFLGMAKSDLRVGQLDEESATTTAQLPALMDGRSSER
jgi:hypothetical protein